MDFYAVFDQVVDLLRSRGRVSYRALKVQFDLDDERLAALKDELLYVHPDSVSEDGPGLVWTGEAPASSVRGPYGADAERRQLTVLFCDLVDSTRLASQFDPEDWREVVRAYYETCGKVIARYEGHIATYLGDGLLVYFGHPLAHEDDAARAVRAGLGMIEGIAELNKTLSDRHGLRLAVRVGCHTGLTVVGEIGGQTRHEPLVLGDLPNIAARLQGVANPNTLVVSAQTYQLLGGLFACQSMGTPPLKGVTQTIEVHHVLYESTARSRLEALGRAGLTPLVGRESEVALLRERWAQSVDGRGQVVVLSGEAGIGKSRLVQVLVEDAAERHAWLIPCQCSPYYQHTALYPVIDLLERVILRFEREESAPQKLRKLEGFLVQSGQPLDEAVPLFAELLSIPLGDGYTAPDVSPEQQRRLTMNALLDLLLNRAAQQPLLFVLEDLHWIDHTTLELINLFVDRISDARILALLTCRPGLGAPWMDRSNVGQVTLNRLPPEQAAELTGRVTRGKALPRDVVDRVIAKTDGVPLFVEELTKMLLESGQLQEREDRYELTGPLPALAIPNTLHDSLMARLDRLSKVKSLAQLAATLGREFSFALLQAVSPSGEGTLRRGLRQLVTAEFLYKQGRPPHVTYRFKHALIQDAAYQSLLKSTRQQHHQRIAEVLETRFPETVATQPELLAHHFTEAGLMAQALPYWQAAGQRALQRCANREAAVHVARGLQVLGSLPETRESARQELTLQIMLGNALGATQGQQAMEDVYSRACELARQVGSPPELFPALWGLWYARIAQGDVGRGRAQAEEFLALAQQQQDPLILAVGHRMLANTALWQGELIQARDHSRLGLDFYDSEQHHASVVGYGQDSGVCCGWIGALALWMLGCPDQAAQIMTETVDRARALAHPVSVAQALLFSAHLHQLRRDPRPARAHAEEALNLCTEQGFDLYSAWCLLPRGWAVAQQGDVAAGVADILKALDARRASGAALRRAAPLPWFLTLLAEAYATGGRFGEGLRAVDDALESAQHNGEHLYEAEVWRLKGELLLSQNGFDAAEAEACFHRGLAVARNQRAKSWELRLATSMSRLWQRQGKRDDARELLATTHAWFTEGSDTADVSDAEALLGELA